MANGIVDMIVSFLAAGLNPKIALLCALVLGALKFTLAKAGRDPVTRFSTFQVVTFTLALAALLVQFQPLVLHDPGTEEEAAPAEEGAPITSRVSLSKPDPGAKNLNSWYAIQLSSRTLTTRVTKARGRSRHYRFLRFPHR